MFRCLALLVCSSALVGQAVEGPVFEAASLKKQAPGVFIFRTLSGGPGTESPLLARMTAPAGRFILDAFDLPNSMFVGLDKVPGDSYDFAATVPEGTTKLQFRTMLLNLLVERFHLRYHRETRDIKAYELRVADGGSKMKAAAGNPVEPPTAIRPTAGGDGDLVFPPGVNTPVWGNGPRFAVQRVWASMDDFARLVTDEWMHAPVANRTGLTGRYDMALRWNAANTSPAVDGADVAASLEPPFDVALRQQLGLLLRETKSPAGVIVIDSIAREADSN